MQIAVENLSKIFGTLRANDGLSLSFAAGQIHGVLGENGAGKSTLMKLLSGFLRPDGGRILVDGRPARLGGPADALRAGVGMVHQDPLDVTGFTVLENFYCAAPRGALPSRAAARRTLAEVAGRMGFSIDPEAPLAGLTVGQRQQLEIARLLACGAGVFILDEPTTGITAAQARALFAALRTLAAEGKTVLFVSHKLDEVAELCDTVSVLRAGRVMGAGQMAMPQPQARLLELMFGEQGEAAEARPAPPAPAGTVPTWRLEGVTAREGNLALEGLSLSLMPGRAVGLAGLEGSGQQILLRLLAGRLRPLAGRLVLLGADVSGGPAERLRRAGVHYLPADRLVDGMIGQLSLADHFALQDGRGALLDRRAATLAAEQAIEAYRIKATAVTPIARLSGGNQQRAMLALLPEQCAGVLCDQPTRGLDVASARAIWGRLMARRDAGAAIVFASADLDEILDHSDEVLVFFGGRVSRPIPRAELSYARLAELIGGVGFDHVEGGRP